jgi:tyrosyl-tRNA synthetase
MPAWRLLVAAGLVSSNSEARRMIRQGAVEIGGRRVSNVEELVSPGQEYVVRVGKRRFGRVVLG